jgi:hypothetical protein
VLDRVLYFNKKFKVLFRHSYNLMDSYLLAAGDGKTKEAMHERERVVQVLQVIKKEMQEQLLAWEAENMARMRTGKS